MNNNSKKKKIIIIISLVLIILLIICTYLYIYNKKELVKYEKEINNIATQNEKAIVDYQEEVVPNTSWTYEDLVNNLVLVNNLSKDTKIKITVNDEVFQDDDVLIFKVGETKINIYLNKSYTYKILKEKTKIIETQKDIIIKVEDKEAPILEGVEDKTITIGDSLDIKANITAKDAVDGNLEVNITGEVNLNKAGTYKVLVSAEDKSGNKVEKEMTITVKEKMVKQEVTTPSKPSSNSSNNKPSTSNNCASAVTLKKRGYKTTDTNACEKDKEASAIAKQIANDILAKGYATDLEKVEAAASRVSEYYSKGTHVESGLDYRTPYGVFIKGEASCAGCTRALILVLEYMGFANLVHANENGWTHQWVILTMDGKKGFADGQVGIVGYGCHFVDENCTEE